MAGWIRTGTSHRRRCRPQLPSQRAPSTGTARETGDGRWETRDERRETRGERQGCERQGCERQGDDKRETRDERRETQDIRQEIRDKKQEARNKKQETRDERQRDNETVRTVLSELLIVTITP